MKPRSHVNAGGDHGRRVDKRAHRCRPCHGIRQPDKQWNLRRLANGADKQQQSNERNDFRAQEIDMLLELDEVQSPNALPPERRDDEQDPEHKTKISNTIDDEGLIPGDRVFMIVVPKTNQEIGTEPDAFPADEKHQEVIAHDQQEHEKNK